MTGGRYHRRKEKMDSDTVGGCDTEDKPFSVSRVPANFPADHNNQEFPGMDFFTQARKALSDRSPFDTEDTHLSSVPILPTGLANLLSKHCDGRKRQKKSNPGAEAKAKGGGGLEKNRGSNFWGKMEEYFRALTVDDIDSLSRTSHFCLSDSEKYFRIPLPGNAICPVGNLVATTINTNGENENGTRSDSITLKEENLDQSMDVDSTGSEATCLNQEEISLPSTLLQQHPCSGLEWLLCAKSKIYLSSERPSKKRKLLGGDAGLERLLAASPVEGSTSLCHYCCSGDSGDQLNRLIVCNSCNMAVHQRCYGVQDDGADSWLCSWCKQKNGVPSLDRPCLLCPKSGGALKPVHKRDFMAENYDAKDFAHLFCSQWIPEVFVTDTRTMEPIMNVDGIKETRRKLICYLCKVKHGACVRCSHGACRTSFHPICAREAMHRMEVWGKSGCDEVELRAFCSKHSGVQNVSINEQSEDLSTVGSEPCTTRHQSVTVTINRPHKLKLGRKNGNKIILHVETGSDIGKPDDSPPSKCGLHDSGSNSRTQTDCSDVELPVTMDALERISCKEEKQESPNIRIILTELINQGKVLLKDIASEMGIPLDSLSAFLIDDSPVPDLHGEVVSWLKRHAYIGCVQKNLKVKIKSSKKALEPVGGQNTLSSRSPKAEDGPDKSCNIVCFATETSHFEQGMLENIESVSRSRLPDSMKTDAVNSSFIHPLIGQEMIKTSTMGLNSSIFASNGNQESSAMDAFCSANGISNHGFNIDHLDMVRNLGPSEISPEEDEVEGELIFEQHQLLRNVLARKHLTDNLGFKVLKTLSHEIDSVREQKWDAVLVNQYFYELRETRKQGRKERRHREAQAVLAAAAAAVASSSRNSSFRKDILEESAQHANSSLYSHQLQTKDALAKLSAQMTLMDRTSDQSTEDITKANLRVCEICMRNETVLSPVLVCSICKVSVHLDCYRSVTNTAGPWQCELCEDSLTSNSEDGPILAAECCLCGGNTGAFRKSVDGQWVHAFCAEWALESSFKRGQANPLCRLDSTMKGNDVCHICCQKKGACIKCSYGHCQSTFHPSCARGVGYYMQVKAAAGGKWQHKAYCDKHSPEQKAKAGSQKHGIDELKSVKQVRVELERLRLLCERLIKREKLKRELALCGEDVVSSSKDSSMLSALVHSPYFRPDGSSESATTSVKGNTDDCRSGSEAVQRSDDVTVDSTTVSGKRRIRFTLSMENDQKTDDSSTSQNVMQKPSDRVSFGGKHIPHRHKLVPRPLLDDGDKWTKPKKLGETFEKELIMTSDQALKKNQRLPKGFVYVPVQCLSNEDESIQDPYSDKPIERES